MIDPCSVEQKPLLSVDEALARIKHAIHAIPFCEVVELKQALGRTLSAPVISPINIPSDRNSAMDGYALASKDIDAERPTKLTVIGASWAGKPYDGNLQSGQCVRIFTGAVLPLAADTVVMQEDVVVQDGNIVLPKNYPAFQNIRDSGEDVKQGGLLCASQKKLTSADLGLLAAAGLVTVSVRRKLKIAIFSTGDELVSPGEPLTTGKIYESNRFTLQGLLTDPAFTVFDLGSMPDDRQLLEHRIEEAANTHDVIITTGGASVGDADYIKDILDSCGNVDFWKLAIKPGKPLAFGKIGECVFFGLPGNPVSVMVTFQQIVAPALKRLSGAEEVKPLRLLATCTSDLKKRPGRQDFQRGILRQDADGNLFVSSTGEQGSHIMSSMSRSNCFIVLPMASNGVKSGESVWVEPFSVML